MNVTSIEEMRLAQAARTGSAPETSPPAKADAPAQTPNLAVPTTDDDKMEQIRQLLLGDRLQSNTSRLAALETRQAEFEANVIHRLDLLSQRLDGLARDALGDRKTAFDELARAMHELGNRVRGI